MREIADKANGVGQRNGAVGIAQIKLPRGGIQRSEQLIGGVRFCLHQGVEKR